MFDELLFKKGKCHVNEGIGLVRADIIQDLSKEDTDRIFQMTKDFYIQGDLYNKVNMFNKEPERFKVDEHIDFCLKHY